MNRKLNLSPIIIFAWASVLAMSDLPDVLLKTFSGNVPAWLSTAKILVPIILLVLCVAWKPIRGLWQFAFVFLVFDLALVASSWLYNTEFWQSHFGGTNLSYSAYYFEFYFRDLCVALVVIATLWLVKRNRFDFFFAKGQTDAPIQPVHWLGIKQGESWRTFGWIFTVCAGIIILIAMAFSVPLNSQAFARALPLIPFAIIFAAINAFTEETYFRASMLSTLCNVTSDNQALLMNVVFFGMAHYLYGTPSGLLGFLLTGFLAFLLGKSMLETRGMFWAWVMHFVPDAIIFFAYALTWE